MIMNVNTTRSVLYTLQVLLSASLTVRICAASMPSPASAQELIDTQGVMCTQHFGPRAFLSFSPARPPSPSNMAPQHAPRSSGVALPRPGP